jgi:hypothetical protein
MCASQLFNTVKLSQPLSTMTQIAVDDHTAVRAGAGGDGIANARSASSGSLFMLLTLPVPLRCESRSGLRNP